MKRAFDLFSATFLGLLLLIPVLVPIAALIYLQDLHSPFYAGKRVGRRGRDFRMVKFRSMVMAADKTGVVSTAADDRRITRLGKFVRAYKLDELPQLWNIVKGEMSFVGPRPQVRSEVELYTECEEELLAMRPGITDLASIVFSDEGEILKGSEDPDLRYHQIIRPWKSRLALFYVQNHSLLMDLRIIYLTAFAIISKRRALRGVQEILRAHNADSLMVEIAGRQSGLEPYPPPGATQVVTQLQPR